MDYLRSSSARMKRHQSQTGEENLGRLSGGLQVNCSGKMLLRISQRKPSRNIKVHLNENAVYEIFLGTHVGVCHVYTIRRMGAIGKSSIFNFLSV